MMLWKCLQFSHRFQLGQFLLLALLDEGDPVRLRGPGEGADASLGLHLGRQGGQELLQDVALEGQPLWGAAKEGGDRPPGL